jgi:microsomal dipeptidase-like Zn-dependent dipeptidase
MGETPLAARQVSRDRARAVAETGGIAAVWAFAQTKQTTPGMMQNYGTLPKLVDTMLKKGFSADETGKTLGGNYVRVFANATGSS